MGAERMTPRSVSDEAMKRTYEQMVAGGGGPPPAAVAREPFNLLPVAPLTRGAVQQLVLQLVFAGEACDANRCAWRTLAS